MKEYHTFFIKAEICIGLFYVKVKSMSGFIQFEDKNKAIDFDYLKRSIVSYYREYSGINCEVRFINDVSYIGLCEKRTKITF